MKNINIIKKNHEFQKIINNKQAIKTKQFFIYFQAAPDHFHYGISVGKKLGNAVVRNKIKRQVRMMIKQILPKVKWAKKSIVIIVRNIYFNYNFAVNEKCLQEQILAISKK